jgi:hypothetical protein
MRRAGSADGDMRMVERRRRAGLSAKALKRERVEREVLRQEFESNMTTQLGVSSGIHHAHPAAKLFQNAVGRNGRSDYRGRYSMPH